MNLQRLLLLTLLCCGACATVGPPPPATGALLAVGGGGMNASIAARALAAAGGTQARLLIVPQASERPEAGVEAQAYWQERGALDVRVLDLLDPEHARIEIAAADFIWFGGGDQNRLMASLREADLVEPIRERWRGGALVGGTSAGAAVLSGAMIVGGENADLESVRAGGTALAEGLGLWGGVIVDQHFLARRRFTRLLAAVLDRPDLIGIGVDERTAVLALPDGRCEVIGEGAVLILDALRAHVLPAEAGELRTAAGVTLAVLRDGMSFQHPPPVIE